MLEVKNFVNIGAGRKSNYEFAKDVLLKKYVNEDLNKCILEIKKDMGIKIQDE